jgi:hypothetical protein
MKGEGLFTYWPQVLALGIYAVAATLLASLRLAREEA